MLHIKDYIDYRKFLKEFYENKKRGFKNYSYRIFCQKAEINSPSFYNQVQRGERNIGPKMIESFIKGLELKFSDADYFRDLVCYCQSKEPCQKKNYYCRLQFIKSSNNNAIFVNLNSSS